MDKDHSAEIIQKSQLEKKFNMSQEVYPDCGHQIIFQEPVQIAKGIVTTLGMKFDQVEVKNLLDGNNNITIK